MNELELGGIYSVKWDKRPMRILAFDDKELFYDCYWSEIDKWTFTGKLKTSNSKFYRISTKYFKSTSKKISLLKLSKEEYLLIKPNFPLRFCRIKDFNFSNFSDYLQDINKIYIQNDCELIFQNKIVLLPRTKKDRIMKGEIVEVKNISELLKKAKELQEINKNLNFNGIGFFRSGIIKKLPSYYIGEYIDLAKIME